MVSAIITGFVLVIAFIVPPASATTVATFTDLQAAFADPASAGGTATLTGDLSGDTLTLAAGTTLTLDLSHATLTTTGRITLGAGSTLRITAPGPAGDGMLVSVGITTAGATLTIDGSAVVRVTSAELSHAAIGGGPGQSGGTITIGGNANVTATSPVGTYSNGAGIGGGTNGAGGTIHITDSAIVAATGGTLGAGIGGGGNSRNPGLGAGGTLTIDGAAQVTATSGEAGAGIGGGDGAGAGSIAIGGTANVRASSVTWGAGIGAGGQGGGGGSLTVTGNPTIHAQASFGHALGSGDHGTSIAVHLLGGTTTVAGPNAFGGTDFGSLEIQSPGRMIVASDSTLTVPNGTTIPGNGFLSGDGTVVNQGAILLPTANISWEPVALAVAPKNYLVSFDASPGAPTVPAVRVFASTFTAGDRLFPPDPTRTGYTFRGWNTAQNGSGTTVTATSTLTASITAYALWQGASQTTVSAPTGVLVAGRTIDVPVTVTSAQGDGAAVVGQVQLHVDGVAVGGPVAYSGSPMTVPYPNPTAGTHTIRVDYSPSVPTNTRFTASSGSTSLTVISQAAATTGIVVATTPGTPVTGDSKTFTATSVDADGVPIADVTTSTTFTSSVLVDVVAGANISFPTDGTRTITGTFGALTGTLGVTVAPVPTTTTVALPTGVLAAGRQIDIPVTVAASTATGSPPPPVGTLRLYVDDAAVGPAVNYLGAVTTVPYANPTAGSHTIRVDYSPLPGYWVASYDSRSLTVLSVADAATSIEVTTTASGPVVGDTVELSAEAFDADGQSLGDVTADTSFTSTVSADLVTGADVVIRTAGSRTLTGTFASLTDSVSVSAVPTPTTTIAAFTGIAVVGRPVDLQVAVRAAKTGAPAPQGTVQAFFGATAVSEPVPLAAAGTAVLPVTLATPGTTSLEIRYTPGAEWLTSASSFEANVLTVTAAVARLEITPSQTRARVGDTITLTAQGWDSQGGSLGDVTALTNFRSQTSGDIVEGNRVTFTHASVHRLVGTLGSANDETTVTVVANADGDGSTGDGTGEGSVDAPLATTGVEGVAALITLMTATLLGGAVLLGVARRRRG